MKHKLFAFILIVLFIFTSLSAENNKLLSFVKSAILPGWGELSQRHNSAYFFFTSELSLLFAYKYYDMRSENKISESLLFAYNRANMSIKLDNEDLRVIVGRYNSSGFESGGYNESIVNKAMSLYPNDTEAQTNYINNNILDESIYWAWQSTAEQNKYRIMRKNSAEYKDITKALTGAVIANHIASAFNAARVTKNSGDLYISISADLKPMLNYMIKF
ncbi:MAG: hypothetical protein PHF36_08355 [Candidatus Cloacimonetes bacterium]|nr:hypothetical protein [Candidatus Cloacimonadota bacterium]